MYEFLVLGHDSNILLKRLLEALATQYDFNHFIGVDFDELTGLVRTNVYDLFLVDAENPKALLVLEKLKQLETDNQSKGVLYFGENTQKTLQQLSSNKEICFILDKNKDIDVNLLNEKVRILLLHS